MFIELTDHLRCPRDHPEAYLVLLPDEVSGRGVRSGQLGCPICGATFRVAEGVAELDALLPGLCRGAVPPLPRRRTRCSASPARADMWCSPAAPPIAGAS